MMKMQFSGRKFPRVISGLLALLMCASALSAPVTLNSAPVYLGIVNGTINGDRVEIKRALDNPILLTVSQAELDRPLKALVIEQARIIESTGRDVVLLLYSPADVIMRVTAELWLDDKLTPLAASQVGGGVEIKIQKKFSHLEIRTNDEIQISVPKNLRGAVDTTLKIRGY